MHELNEISMNLHNFVYAGSEGSSETAHNYAEARRFTARLCDKCQISVIMNELPNSRG